MTCVNFMFVLILPYNVDVGGKVKGFLKYIFVAIFCVFCAGVVHAYECTESEIDTGSECVETKFSVTTSAIGSGTFVFKMAARGTFYVDCGTGGTLSGTTVTGAHVIQTNNANQVTYTCTYSGTSRARTVRFAGEAQEYNSSASSSGATLSMSNMFSNSGTLITKISGTLGTVFPTKGNTTTTQPNFYQTFRGATNLREIPADLFHGIEGARASMFSNTFYGCTGLQYIPYGLFRDISGTADYLFSNTFNGCTGLTTLPEDLFSGITGSSQYLFSSTFNNCSGLKGYIPKSVFAGLITAGFPTATSMMANTFANTGLSAKGSNGEGCTNIGLQTVTITANASTYAMNSKAFCEPGTKSVVRLMDGDRFLQTVTATNGSAMPTTDILGNALTEPRHEQYIFKSFAYSNTNYYTSALTSARSWNQSVGVYILTAQYVQTKFNIFADVATNGTFKFKISAKGTFYVDCGADGNLSGTNALGHTISRASASTSSITEFTCTYTSGSGDRMISFGGVATAYDTETAFARSAIQFTTPATVTGMDGALGSVFPTIGNGTSASQQPKFASTFKDCVNLEKIPANLFSGVTKNGRFMFQSTFEGCTSLTYIPQGLFAGNTGSNGFMFGSTFKGCTGLGRNSSFPDPIPADLFENINTASGSLFSSVFQDCTGLTYIPSDLFKNVVATSSTTEMFTSAFQGCTGLTALPENLFKNITVAASKLFSNAFKGCTSLRGFIPPSMFGGLINAGSPNATLLMNSIFDDDTLLDETCPTGYGQVITGYESYWNSKVACAITSNYNISYVLNGGTNYVNAPTTYVAGTGATINGTPTKTGYTFDAWCRDRKITDMIGTDSCINFCSYDNYGNEEGSQCSTYGLTSSNINTFVADFGNYGVIRGHGRCSTQSGTNNNRTWTDPTIFSSLTDETGQTGAQYCYCNFDLYTPYGGTAQSISSPWVYLDDKTDAGNCADKCAPECVYMLNGSSDNFRESFYPVTYCAASQTIGTDESGNQTFTAQWTPNYIEIVWQDAAAADVTANDAGHVTYDSDIRTPANPPYRPGKIFTGWAFSNN